MEKSDWSKSIPLKEQFQIVKRMFYYAKPYKKQFFIAIFWGACLAVINVMLPKILQVFMDDYLTTKTATSQVILTFAALYFGVTLVKIVVWFLQMYLYQMATEKTVQNIRNQLFEKLHTLGMRYFDQTPAGSIVSRVTNDTETIKDFWGVYLTVLQGLFAIVSAFTAMFLLNRTIALWCLLFLPVLLVIVWYYQRFSSKVYRGMREKLSQLNTKLNESISGMSIIQQFRQEKRLQKEFNETNESYYRSRVAMVKTNALLLGPIINLLYTFSLAVVLGFFGYDALKEPVSVGVIYAFISYVQSFFNPMTNMMDNLSIFQDGMVSSGRVLRIMDNQELSPAQSEQAAETIQDAKIEFKDVSFSYDGEHNVLHHISFTANPGETVALVGHTGSGKSSIINVMMRFYEFYEGDILIDGKSIKNYPITELRQKMGLVLQDSFLFYGNIKNNIRLMNPLISDAAIEDAARFVQADTFINQLPNDYESKVIERGASYSSGQKQLISFARTIVTDPKILVLDEATANIDTETETLIQEGLKKMRKGRTTIAIAHRLSTIRDANLILVLDHGEIVERGSHDELIDLGGIYYDMYRLQNSEES
ncbi:ABC transporter ATP-binding protein [Carnobacterium divergens]|uniref:ABC transporter, ATP-binding permease protein, MDR family n=2 Tax=Carnobacterium divergens TaxID=2748 RepID=A0A0R2HW85_CARDV|nr:ABC transporter ATP-binding protein [Carnobacterium divergens]ANZ99785.1 multidrug ABC transporter ATP-binding protein [Carnobacterium divergens]KRN54154.1 ABC transporter, ATP-binding permease protein, MDR family [Carnobacterium divergens DSM 20623]MDO0873641.1 ABC transporter ATP-binding protein/permease [Carnobacterium divergens]MDT1957943.1 ABC transporter ATP-binding protein/permease [Carnobacterium divergens]MDT1973946.1 ABC transporter ATP-binding protein/permease [Carnobacterium div